MDRAPVGFTELIEHLPTSPDGVAGGFLRNATTLLVHLDYQRLLDQLGSADSTPACTSPQAPRDVWPATPV